MAIRTMPRGKRRKNLGGEANDFIKGYLAVQKSFSDSALAEKRGKLYDAQIKRYEEMNEDSRARRERAAGGGGGGAKGAGLSKEKMDEHIRTSLAPKAPAAKESGGASPPIDQRMLERAKGQPTAPVEGGGTPTAAPPAAKPVAPLDQRDSVNPIRPELRGDVEPGNLTRSVETASLGAIPDGTSNEEVTVGDVGQQGSDQQLAAIPDEYNYGNYEGSYGGNSNYDVAEAIPDYELTSFAAEGGPIEEAPMQKAPAEEAPLEVALDAALRNVQSSYGLDRRAGAVDDGSGDGNLEAFQRNSGGVPEETMTELLSSVDPASKDKIGAVLQKVYGFHAAKGDKQGAAEAVGSIIQTARQESMDSGALALAAIEQRDFVGAGDALIDAYNKVPDGRYVEGSVDERGVGEALIYDARTDKVVERIPLNPQTLQMAAKRFQTGSDFYNHVAQFARASKPAPQQRMALAYEGGPIEEEEPQDAIEAADKEDAALVEALPVEEAVPTQRVSVRPPAPGEESEFESDRPARGAQDVEQAVRPYVPYAEGMNAAQRRQVDYVNRRLDAEYKAEQSRREKARVESRQDARTMYTEGRQDTRADRREAFTDRRTAEARKLALEKEARDRAVAEHTRNLQNPDYRREYELAPLAKEEQKDVERKKQFAGEVARASLSGEDIDITGQRKPEERSPANPFRNPGLARENAEIDAKADPRKMQRLQITARNAEKFDAADPLKIEDEITKYAKTVKLDQTQGVDTKQGVAVSDEFKSGMAEVASNLTAFNRITGKYAAQTVFDAVYKTTMAPVVTKSGEGYRVSIGERSVVMDPNTFRQMALLRRDRTKEVNEINAPIVARKAAKEQERINTDFSRREGIDTRDTYTADDVMLSPFKRARESQERRRLDAAARKFDSNR